MLAEKERLKSIGAWNPVGDGAAKAWEVQASADFVGHQFGHDVSFDGLEFPGVANFGDSRFSVQASFKKTRFHGLTDFHGAILKGSARFDGAIFEGIANFRKAVFLRGAEFSEAKFCQNVSFEEVEITHNTKFENSNFLAEVSFSRSTLGGDVSFLGTKFDGVAIFFGAAFLRSSEFSNTKFSEEARFTRAEFSHTADFDSVTFCKTAAFSRTKFSETAHFSNSSFCGRSEFNYSKFSSTVRFSNTSFRNKADFDLARFEGYTDFSRAELLQNATFVAIRGESFFTLENAVFHDVPDFQQAHFSEAPRLDVAKIVSSSKRKQKHDLSPRWRALKRLAVQAHDHEREQLFFASEVRALRGTQDRALPDLKSAFKKGEPIWSGGTRYWIGVLYQGFSDFGRSMLRPFLWWCATTIVSTIYYFWRHFVWAEPNYPISALNWLWRSLVECALRGVPMLADILPYVSAPTANCIYGTGKPLSAAFYLAIHNGAIVASLGGTEKLKQAYSCLYGRSDEGPVIPYSVVYGGLTQTLLSAVFVFLILLAIRNHFRIK